MDRSDASAGLAFLVNGAKETRTPDPLHAIQVLFASNLLPQLGQSKSIKFLEQFLEHNRPSSRQRLWLQNELDNVGAG